MLYQRNSLWKLLNAFLQNDTAILQDEYVFMWNTKIINKPFKNKIMDAVLNYVYVNSAGIIVKYKGKTYHPKKQNQSHQSTNKSYQRILIPFLMEYLKKQDNIDFFLTRNEYPFSTVSQNDFLHCQNPESNPNLGFRI